MDRLMVGWMACALSRGAWSMDVKESPSTTDCTHPRSSRGSVCALFAAIFHLESGGQGSQPASQSVSQTEKIFVHAALQQSHVPTPS